MPRRYREKRRFPRVCIRFDVLYKVNNPPEIRMKVGDEERRATLLNISEAGMAILTDKEIPEATELEMLFNLNPKDAPAPSSMYVVGRIRHVTGGTQEEGCRLGIEFIDIADEDRRAIAEFIRTTLAMRSPQPNKGVL